ncbi:MAG: cytochrome c biogenesis protein ResB, partial [Spirochaetaceae bacterium]|nr:cytochrome c biogenesis protein ResB [Spirochaetaceae bacterium]
MKTGRSSPEAAPRGAAFRRGTQRSSGYFRAALPAAFRAIGSTPLSIALIAYLACLCAVASFGQGRAFSSLAFVLPGLLLLANLSTCLALRLLRQQRRPSGESRGRSHGPAILHLGLVLLIASAAFGQAARSFGGALGAGRPEGYAKLAIGDAVELGGGKLLVLKDYRILEYPDGRLRERSSVVDVTQGDTTLSSAFEITVNSPLRLGSLSVFQSSGVVEQVATLEGPGGGRVKLAVGEGAGLGETEASGAARITLLGMDEGRGEAVFRLEDESGERTISVSPGGQAGPFTLLGDEVEEYSVLRAVSDPVYPLVLAALAL